MTEPAEPPERTALYRFYDADGRLLYVGITSNPELRWIAHDGTRWSRLATRRTMEWFGTRKSAAAAERVAIASESPIHNVAHNYTLVPFPCTHWPSLEDAGRQKAARLAELIRTEISTGRWPARHKIPKPPELAAAVNIGTGAAGHAVQILRGERLLYRYRSVGYFVSRP